MPRSVTYRIIERPDGLLDISVTSATGFTVLRRGFRSCAEAAAALDELRVELGVRAWHLVHAGGPALA